jgi:hypothetical protein
MLLLAGCAASSDLDQLHMRINTLEDEVGRLKAELHDQKFVDQVARNGIDSVERLAKNAQATADSAASNARDAYDIARDLKNKNGYVCRGVGEYAHYFRDGTPADFAAWFERFGC